MFKKLSKSNLPKKNPDAFTLMEVLIVMTGFFLLLTVLIQVYIGIVKSKYGVQARQHLLQESYYTLEKLNIEIKDFSIDYEEYFNRQQIGCDTPLTGKNFLRNIHSGSQNGYCDLDTFYGNQGSRYYCSSMTGYLLPDEEVIESPGVKNGSGCTQEFISGYQAYGQYAYQFIDVKQDVDFLVSAVGDNDDEDLGIGPQALQNTDNIQELYLISSDQTQRLFIRRALIATGDRDQDGIISGADEQQYVLQILRLKGFDAGAGHDFTIAHPGVYDGKIDTRACDFAQGFVCQGTGVELTLYSGYHLPQNQNDGRITLTDDGITIDSRGLHISPHTNGSYARKDDLSQINPFIRIRLTSKLYGAERKKRLGAESIENFQVTLQTMFNTRGRYTQ